MKTNIIQIAILIGLIALLIGGIQLCNRAPEYVTETSTDTLIQYDSVEHLVYRDRLVPKYIHTSDTVVQIDSVFCTQLASDFYSTIGYSDTLQDDSLAFIALKFEVYKNRAQHLTHIYKNRTPTEIINNTTTTFTGDRPRFRFYAGPIVTYVKGNAPGVGGGVLLSSKTFAAGYSFDVTNKMNYLQMYFSIIRGSKGN